MCEIGVAATSLQQQLAKHEADRSTIKRCSHLLPWPSELQHQSDDASSSQGKGCNSCSHRMHAEWIVRAQLRGHWKLLARLVQFGCCSKGQPHPSSVVQGKL
jgi:hypothetical protein